MKIPFLILFVSILPFFTASAEESSSSDLEKALANPFADLTTLPIQFNYYMNTAKDYETQTVLKIQPVFAASMGDSWGIVNRVIMPISSTPASGTGSVSGFGDLIYQGYYVPTTSGALSYGVGAMISLPTGADPAITSGKFGAGPALGLVYTLEQWSLGGLVTQNWSFAGDPDRDDVSFLLIQPLVSYRLGGGWSVSPLNNITYNEYLDGEKWTIPVGIAMTKLMVRKAVPINLVFGAFGRVVKPDGAPDVEGKAQMNLVF